MKNIAISIILSFSLFVSVSESYELSEKYAEGFEHKFYFGTKEYMKEFSQKLKEAEILFVVYESGAIGYKNKDKNKVQIIGDELTSKYFGNKQ